MWNVMKIVVYTMVLFIYVLILFVNIMFLHMALITSAVKKIVLGIEKCKIINATILFL